jgi:dTDP-4-amino-4,6-dideoxygalactose transaminase
MSNNRKRLIRYLNEKGIEVGTHYRPIHTMAAYKQKSDPALPITENVGRQIITIPIHSNLNDDHVSYIIEAANKFA